MREESAKGNEVIAGLENRLFQEICSPFSALRKRRPEKGGGGALTWIKKRSRGGRGPRSRGKRKPIQGVRRDKVVMRQRRRRPSL